MSGVDTRARELHRDEAKSDGTDWRTKVPGIVEAINRGLSLTTSCALNGVSRRTMDAALLRCDPAALPIVEARAAIEEKLVKTTMAHAEGGTPHGASTWLLERMFPAAWKAADKLELSGPDGAPMQTQAVTLTLADAVAGARGEGSG